MQYSQPRAILLDMDDTIIPDSTVSKQSWHQACREFAISNAASQALADTSEFAEQLYSAIQEQSTWYWSDPARHQTGRLNLHTTRQGFVLHALQSLGISSCELESAADTITTRFMEIKETLVVPFPGAIETIQTLRREGYKLALLTNGNGTRQRAKVERHQLTQLFDCILIEGELGFGKPDTRVYSQALRALNVRPEDTWMVGDNLQWEVLAPQQLGIRGIWVDHAGNGIPKHITESPFAIIHTLSELLQLLVPMHMPSPKLP